MKDEEIMNMYQDADSSSGTMSTGKSQKKGSGTDEKGKNRKPRTTCTYRSEFCREIGRMT